MSKPIVRVEPSDGKNRLLAVGLVLAYLMLSGVTRAEYAHSYWEAKIAVSVDSRAGSPPVTGPVLACATKKSDDDNLLGLGVVLDDLLGGLLGGLSVRRIAVISWSAVEHATSYDVEFTTNTGVTTISSTPINSFIVSNESDLVSALLGTVGAVLLPVGASTAQVKVRPKFGMHWVGSYSASAVTVRHSNLSELLFPGVYCVN